MTTIPCYGIVESHSVKEQFHLGNPFDPKDQDGRVTQGHPYEALPSYIGVVWSEIKIGRRIHVSEKQELRPSPLTDARDTDDGEYLTRIIVDHALDLQETAFLPSHSPHGHLLFHLYLSGYNSKCH